MLAGTMAESLEIDANLARRVGTAARHRQGDGVPDRNRQCSIERKPWRASAVKVRKSSRLSRLTISRYPHVSAIAIIVKAADEISTSRPGARKEKAEDYVRRMREIEEIASANPGVKTAHALQNGREVRVLVDSATVDDTYADQLAEEITETPRGRTRTAWPDQGLRDTRSARGSFRPLNPRPALRILFAADIYARPGRRVAADVIPPPFCASAQSICA